MPIGENFVWLNGKFKPENKAKISIYDRGLIFADAVYEVVLAKGNKLFDFDAHFNRLSQSLHKIKITNPLTKKDFLAIINELINKNNLSQNYNRIYIQISRGNQNPRNMLYDNSLIPNCFITINPIKISQKLRKIKATLQPDIRWHLGSIKSTNLLANCLLFNQANANDNYQEVIMQRDGLISEATSSNIFLVKNGQIHTPKLTDYILAGTTRNIVIDIAKQMDIPIFERNIAANELTDKENLKQIDEIWLTSSVKLIWLLEQLDQYKMPPIKAPLAAKILAKILEKIETN